jgi:endonuclease-8
MPEGPEIRRAADRIGRVLVGQEVVDAYFGLARLRRYGPRLKGCVVTSVDTRGKAMLTRFDSGLTLYSHNQLYGVWLTSRRDRPPKTGRSLRVALHTSTHSALLYSASDIEVLDDRRIEQHPFLSRIGPDILDRRIARSDVLARLDDTRFRRRSIGSLYLDQSFMAGVGNYLRSEILFVAGVHYKDSPARLDDGARRRLAAATLDVSRRSYRSRGVTLDRSLSRSLRDRGLSHAQCRFWVFRRDGSPCHRCSTPIERVAVSSRSLYFCPSCQRRASSHADTASSSRSSRPSKK